MPHLIIEYSANIEAEVPPQRMLEEFHRTAIEIGIAEPVGVRTRLERRDHYRVGDDGNDNAFVHIVARMRSGRTAEQKKALLEALMDRANKTLAPAFDARGVALTIEVQEIDPEFRVMRNGLRERAAKAGAA
jgi:5-carboxymethyl-2-hydroxymuconate isomerase